MIYELKTYDLRPHAIAEVERRFALAYEQRRVVSDMAASFHTEIGPLNQLVQVWPYPSLDARDRARAAASSLDGWPPEIGEFVVREISDVYVAFDFSPPMTPGSVGPYFEIRTYEYAAGDLAKIAAAWEAALPGRLELSPLMAICYAEEAGRNRLLHIWAYKTLEERAEVRARSRESGAWPPHVLAKKRGWPAYTLLRQENKIMLPSPTSALR